MWINLKGNIKSFCHITMLFKVYLIDVHLQIYVAKYFIIANIPIYVIYNKVSVYAFESSFIAHEFKIYITYVDISIQLFSMASGCDYLKTF